MESGAIYYVYQLRRADSALPFYIGKGKKTRLNNHFGPASLARVNRKNGAIKKAMKDGVEILRERIHVGMTENGALLMEVGLISLHGRLDMGTGTLTNMSDGGDGTSGRIVSAEAREKTASYHRGQRFSEERKLKMSVARTGCPGVPCSEENKLALSSARKGISTGPRSEETRRKQSEAMKGRVVTAEVGKKISAAKKGKPGRVQDSEVRAKISSSMKGVPKSPETIAKMRAAAKLREEAKRLKALTTTLLDKTQVMLYNPHIPQI